MELPKHQSGSSEVSSNRQYWPQEGQWKTRDRHDWWKHFALTLYQSHGSRVNRYITKCIKWKPTENEYKKYAGPLWRISNSNILQFEVVSEQRAKQKQRHDITQAAKFSRLEISAMLRKTEG